MTDNNNPNPIIDDEPTPQQPQNSPTPQQPQNVDTNAIVESVLSALDARTKRAENSVIRSVAQQNGLSEDELTTLINDARAKKAEQLPEAAQRKIDEATNRANARLINAEGKAIATELGFANVSDALKLINHNNVKVTDDDNVEGLREELEALAKESPYLLKGAGGAWGAKQGGSVDDHHAQFRSALGLTNKKE